MVPAASRCRCSSRRDPAIPRREDRQAAAARPGAALADDPVGAFPDRRDRADVRPGRLLQQISPARILRTSVRCKALRQRGERLARRDGLHIAGRQWFMDDDYTIADISMLGWVRNIVGFYEAGTLVEFDSLKHVPGLARARPGATCGGNAGEYPEAAVGKLRSAKRL